jgi:chemotaxis protein CheX
MEIGENKLRESIETIWSSMLGLDVNPGAPPLAPRQRPPDLLTGCVQITGKWQGAVTLDCSPELARKAAAIMFGVEPRETTIDQIHDALGELTNIIGGNVKSLLPDPCHLSLPAVTAGSDYLFQIVGTRVVAKVCFTCQNSPFQVTISEGLLR